MKLHLGNGTVYLDGYVNIDILGKLAIDHPELVEHNRTTVAHYYKYPFRQNKGNNVSDRLMDVRSLDFEDCSIDEILWVNLIDHLKKEDFILALKEWRRVLAYDGKLIIDVDDRAKQAQILINAETNEEIEWALRLIYCDHVREGRTHLWGYTPSYLKYILLNMGFVHIWTGQDYILHDVTSNFQIMVRK